MIARMWHGRVPTSKAPAYREFLNSRAIPDYRATPGNISVHILERQECDVSHFMTLTVWVNLSVIQNFAGDDVARAKYYPEDKEFLLEFEPVVVHYEVVGKARSRGTGASRANFYNAAKREIATLWLSHLKKGDCHHNSLG